MSWTISVCLNFVPSRSQTSCVKAFRQTKSWRNRVSCWTNHRKHHWLKGKIWNIRQGASIYLLPSEFWPQHLPSKVPDATSSKAVRRVWLLSSSSNIGTTYAQNRSSFGILVYPYITWCGLQQWRAQEEDQAYMSSHRPVQIWQQVGYYKL